MAGQRNFAPPSGFVVETDQPQIAPPEGFEIVGSAPKSSLNDDPLRPAVQKMFDEGRPLSEINKLLLDNGRGPFEGEALRNATKYEAFRQRNPGKRPNIRITGSKGRQLPETSAGGAFGRGLLDGASLESADEIGAGLNTAADVANEKLGAVGVNALAHMIGAINPIAGAIVLSQSGRASETEGMTLGDRFNHYFGQEQDLRAADDQSHPLASGVGNITGTVGTALIPLSSGPRAVNYLGRIGRGVKQGALAGGITGFNAGTGDLEDRAAGGVRGAVTGGVTGGALETAAPVVSRVAGAVAERTGLLPAARRATSGLDALYRRATVSADEASARAAELRANNIDPTLVDVINPKARVVVSTAASKTPEAGAATRDFAEGRAIDAQDRVAAQSRRIITPNETRPATTVREELETARTNVSDKEFTAARQDPVPITDSLHSTLGTGEGQSAIRAAIRMEKDKATREGLQKLGVYARGSREAEIPAELAGLSPAARASAMRQLGIEAPEAPNFTAGMADKISKALNSAAEVAARQGNKARAAVLRGFGKEIREAAAASSPQYAKALENYGTFSKSIGGIDTGADALNPRIDPTEFRGSVYELGDNAIDVGGVPVPSPRDMARLGARDAIETAAGQGPRQALDAANRLAIGSNQRRASEALLGTSDAEALARGMADEVEIVRNARDVLPKTGGAVDEATNEAMNFLGNLSISNKFGIAHNITRAFARAGIREVDANRLITYVLDPAKTDEAIEYLIARGAKEAQARALFEAARNGLSRIIGGVAGQGSNEITPELTIPQ